MNEYNFTNWLLHQKTKVRISNDDKFMNVSQLNSSSQIIKRWENYRITHHWTIPKVFKKGKAKTYNNEYNFTNWLLHQKQRFEYPMMTS
jgi:hypothetical protein